MKDRFEEEVENGNYLLYRPYPYEDTSVALILQVDDVREDEICMTCLYVATCEEKDMERWNRADEVTLSNNDNQNITIINEVPGL